MKVAIAGYGIEGEANYHYWNNQSADITIFDSKDKLDLAVPTGVPTVLGEDSLKKIHGFDLVIRTAGLNPNLIQTDGKIWSATNEFFAQCPAPIIGVTGTKGKGTTCSLIAEILKNAGKTVHLVGNIGVPALDILPTISADDIVVFELSSFQLWDLKKSPQVAVVLMIEADHLDVHASMEEYIEAKSNIGKFQNETDLIVYHPTNQYSAQIAEKSAGEKKRFMTSEGATIVIPAEAGIQKKDWIPNQVWDDGSDYIVIEDQPICRTSEVGLIGQHNIENICAAITAAWRYTKDISATKKAITSFTGLPHRLEFIREVNGVKYYDDSFSSAPGATTAAIKSFSQPEILICGGFDRGLDYGELAQNIASQKYIKKVLLMGATKHNIADALARAGFSNFEILQNGDFKHDIHMARDIAKSGDVVILSPGCASFDMFKDFKDRGNQFRKIIEDL